MRGKESVLLFSKVAAAGALLLLGLSPLAPASERGDAGRAATDDPIAANATRMLDEGRHTFRYETFGDQVFWSRILGIHQLLSLLSLKSLLSLFFFP